MLRAGTSDHPQSGRAFPFPSQTAIPERSTDWRDFLSAGDAGSASLRATAKLQISADFTQEDYKRPLPSPENALGGTRLWRARAACQPRTAAHPGAGPDLRAVWGLGWKQSQAWSRHSSIPMRRSATARSGSSATWVASERTLDDQCRRLRRRSQPQGTYVAPRLMFNHHFTPDHAALRRQSFGADQQPARVQGRHPLRPDQGTTAGPTVIPRILPRSGPAIPDIRRNGSRAISPIWAVPALQLTLDVRAWTSASKGRHQLFRGYRGGQNQGNPARVFGNLLDFSVRGHRVPARLGALRG